MNPRTAARLAFSLIVVSSGLAGAAIAYGIASITERWTRS